MKTECYGRAADAYEVELLIGPESEIIDGIFFRTGVAVTSGTWPPVKSYVLESGDAVHFGVLCRDRDEYATCGPGFRLDPASRPDPKLDPEELIQAMNPEGEWNDAFSRIDGPALSVPLAMLISRLDRRILELFPDEAPTVSEYCFLARGAPEYVQAVKSYPWLLRFLLEGTVSSAPRSCFAAANKVAAAIEGRRQLVPALCDALGATPSVVRTMAGMPAHEPEAKRWAEDPFPLVRSLLSLAPEKRPKDDVEWVEFLGLLDWCECVLGTADRAVLPALAARVWGGGGRNSRNRPSEHDARLVLSEIRLAVETAHCAAGIPLEGTVGAHATAVKATMLPGDWAAFDAVFRDPIGIVAMAESWNRRTISEVRDAIGKEFAGEGLPRFLHRAYETPSGYTVAQIDGVAELVAQAEAARNCIASYLPQLFDRKFVLLSIRDADGVLAGHAELTVEGNSSFAYVGFEISPEEPEFFNPEIAESRAPRNASLSMAAHAALQWAFGKIRATHDFREFFIPIRQAAEFGDERAERARKFIGAVTFEHQARRATSAFEEAARRYGLKPVAARPSRRGRFRVREGGRLWED